jgi:CRISPR-associated endonuclease Cas1
MLQANTPLKDTAKNEWAIRGDYWLKKINPAPQYKARKRRVIHKPLVLSGHGIKLNIDCGTLLIKCGFTHYPQTREEYRFFPNDRQLPSRIVILDGDGSISLNALEWLSEQGVSLVQIDWQGKVAYACGNAYASNSEFVQKQWQYRDNGKGFDFAKQLIIQKINNSCETIKQVSNNDPEASDILEKMQEQVATLKTNKPSTSSDLLSLEGNAAATYFRHWYTYSLKWRGLNKKPIPPEWLTIGSRIGKNNSNQFASHPVNAMLNYAYGVLENQVRGHILTMGGDPTIGVIHSRVKNRDSFVFDLMEPVRPIMDKHVFSFVLNRTLSPDDFILNKDGVCRLHPQFARFFVKQIQDIPEIEKITTSNLKKMFDVK